MADKYPVGGWFGVISRFLAGGGGGASDRSGCPHHYCWCRRNLSPGDWPRRHVGLHGWGWLTSVRGGKPLQLCEGCWELLWLLCGPRGGGKLSLLGSTGPLFRWRGPRACTFWNGEVLGMCAPWICVRPGALLRRIGRHVFGAGWRKSKEIPGWCRPRVPLPPTMGVHWL